MSHLDVLREINQRGLSLTVAGADLKLAGPKQRVDAELVGRIRAVKPELIEYLSAKSAARGRGFGLTLLQRAYLIGRGDSAPMGNVASHIYHEVDGFWDTGRLESALRSVVARHGMLRTCFTEDGEQVTEPEVDVRIARLDLSGVSEAERQATLAELRRERSHRMLPIDRAPMIAVEITQLAEVVPEARESGTVPEARESSPAMRLHVSTDGLVLDGISTFMFFIDWHRCYTALVRGDCPPEPPGGQAPAGDDVAFADYVAALEAAKDQPQTRRSRDYWLDRLDDLPPHPGLPLAANPASVTAPRFTQYAARLDQGPWEQLKARAAAAGLTPTVVLLAAYAETLARWGAGNRFTLTTTIANRPPIHPNIADALGNFSQTMLVEIGIDRRQSFTERAQALQARMRRDLDHRHFSGIEVLRELARRKTGADAMMPFTFNSTIGYLREDVDGSAVDLFGPEIYTSSQTPQLWLNAFAFEYHGGVVVQVDAVDGLFPDGMIASMVRGYAELLTSLGGGESWSASTFDLRPAEQRERRAAVNDTATPPDDSLVYEAFLAQAARRPDAPAVLTTSGSLTYGELLAQATSAAGWLAEGGAGEGGAGEGKGAGRDELVGLIMRRGPEQVVGILATVLAGAAYLPVDAGLPPERIRYMLTDGQVKLALSNVGWSADGVVTLDSFDRSSAGFAPPRTSGGFRGVAPPGQQSADDLAYVLYTSGTTGEPKGVMISHRSVVNVVTDCNRRFGVGPGDRFIGVSAFNFDLSVYDVFGALSVGAAIVLPDADKAADPAHWLDLCDRFGVTIWNSVPAIASLMAEDADEGDSRLAALRLIMMSGDRIPPALPAALWRVRPDLTLMSLGGPTETTIWNISHPIDRAQSELEPVPYGRPNANNQAYILDADGLDTPDWVTGEICAAGTGLARGYWADEQRTADRFWFDEARGTRLYRTGDLGRYRPDGSIDIAGRSDFQIKINGYRIEAGEVETRLAAIDAVKQAAVVRQSGGCASPGGRSASRGEPPNPRWPGPLRGDRLIAHLVPAGDVRPSDEEIKVALREHLPEYMTPSSVVWHDSLPLTANGKVDRGRLTALAPTVSAPGQASISEHPEIEAKLTELWASVLRVPASSIAPGSDFYELGGDSLAGARVFTGIRKQFGVTITLDRLYELRHLHALANCVAGADS